MIDEKIIDDCWNTIGCWGDQLPRCSKLNVYGHCFNCEVYSGAGRKLLNRESPPGYLDEWKKLLSSINPEHDQQISSLFIFSVSGQYFALPTSMLMKVTEYMPTHAIPHSRNDAVQGITNIDGELMISVVFMSVIHARDIDYKDEEGQFKRNIVIKVDSGKWAVPVHEVFGIHKLDVHEKQVLRPEVISDCISGAFKWQEKNIALIDNKKLASALEEIRI